MNSFWHQALGFKLVIAIGLIATSIPELKDYSVVIGIAANQLWLWRT